MKRIFDVALASAVLVLAGPLFLLLALVVRWKLGSPVLFRQARPGYGGRIFNMVKFRSMTSERSADGKLLPDHQRLTPFGRKLREWSLDELPELWNILTGEMSLVGPRPLMIEYLPRYNATQARRHDMRPGITGLAQVNGRNAISWEEKFRLDVHYIDHFSLWLDVKILFATFSQVIGRRGVNSSEEVTMPPFMGSEA